MSKIDLFPPEILEKIFFECLPPPIADSMYESPKRSHTFKLDQELAQYEGTSTKEEHSIMALLKTSHRWRDIALHSPRLWACLDIDLDKYSQYPDRFADLLQRSGSVNLQVLLRFNPRNLDRKHSRDMWDGITRLMELLRPHYSRLGGFIFVFDHFDKIRVLRRLFPANEQSILPRIHYIHGYSRDPYSVPSSLGAGRPIITAPLLKSCTAMAGFNLVWKSLEPDSINNLTDLSLGFLRGPDWDDIQLISACQNLRKLSLFRWRDGPLACGPSEITLPFLQCLSIQYLGIEKLNGVSIPFRTPQLVSFTIYGHGEKLLPWVMLYLEQNPQIKELYIISFHIPPNLSNTLGILSGLRVLTLSGCRVSPPFFSIISTSKEKEPFYLHNLWKFTLERLPDQSPLELPDSLLHFIHLLIQECQDAAGLELCIFRFIASARILNALNELQKKFPKTLKLQPISIIEGLSKRAKDLRVNSWV